ncbi:unnamed protein product [Thlaspi arvense]|uniref:Uncharacterized protein n=1 Tax=Thlaspi arvense TaxID=13288 RepID=A0AAU9SJ29_THLAR|nr:unnamed protein product [Thlaspi arvense]
MAERFSKLSHNEKHNKSTNLSQFLNKKLNDERKRSLENNDNKFSEKVLELEHSLESRLRIFKDKRRFLQTETDQNQSLAVSSDCVASRSTEQNQMISSGRDKRRFLQTETDQNQSLASLAASSGFTTHLSPSLNQQWTESSTNHLSGGFATGSLDNHQSKFSIFLYNHDNGSFFQLDDSVYQAMATYDNPSMGQGFGLRSCSNNMAMMQRQNPLLHYDMLL